MPKTIVKYSQVRFFFSHSKVISNIANSDNEAKMPQLSQPKWEKGKTE